MLGLIDHRNLDWKRRDILNGFAACYGVSPSEAWRRPIMECACCDDDEEESKSLLHRCYVTEYHFGLRWIFVIVDHLRPEQHNKVAALRERRAAEKDPDVQKALADEIAGTEDLAGQTSKCELWIYHHGNLENTLVFAGRKPNRFGQGVGTYCRAETAILQILGAGQAIPERMKEAI
jgi:hypothetical protein